MQRMAVTLLAFVLLAGCSDPGSSIPSPSDPTSTQGDTETPAPEPGPAGDDGAADQPPSASIAASIANGTGPFTTNFTLEGHDPEGALLAWEFDAAGNGTFRNGTGLPAYVEQVFSTPGNHTVVLRVSDGNHTVEANMTVTVMAAAAMPYQYAEGGITGESAVCYGGPDVDMGEVVIDIDPATWGEAFTITFRSGAAHDAYAFFNDAGTSLASGSGGLSGGGWTFTGSVPAEAATLSLYACGNTFDETYQYEAGTPPE